GFFSALCRLFGISRKTGYKWLQRFDPSDLSSLSDRSRAPHSHSRTCLL
ncbi:leucine zipper domain-containing protein, partial [Enterobacter hormaechei]